jgi:hypothetical protein
LYSLVLPNPHGRPGTTPAVALPACLTHGRPQDVRLRPASLTHGPHRMCVCGGVCILVAAGAMSGGVFGSAAAAKQLSEGENCEGASAEGNGGIGELCAKMTAIKMSVQQSATKMAQDAGLAKRSRRILAPVAEDSSQRDVPEDGEAGTVLGSEDGAEDLWGPCDAMAWKGTQASRVIKTKRIRDDGRGRRRGGAVLAKVLAQDVQEGETLPVCRCGHFCA